MEFKNQNWSSLFPHLQEESNYEIFKLRSQLSVLQQENHNLKRLNKVLMQSAQQLSSDADYQPCIIVQKEKTSLHSQEIDRIQNIYHHLIKNQMCQGKQQARYQQKKSFEEMMYKYQDKFKGVLKELQDSVKQIKKDRREIDSKYIKDKKYAKNRKATDYCNDLPTPLKPQIPQEHNISFMVSDNSLTSRSQGNSYQSYLMTTLSQTYKGSWFKKY